MYLTTWPKWLSLWTRNLNGPKMPRHLMHPQSEHPQSGPQYPGQCSRFIEAPCHVPSKADTFDRRSFNPNLGDLNPRPNP